MARYHYRRVSTKKQKLERQLNNAIRVYPEFLEFFPTSVQEQS